VKCLDVLYDTSLLRLHTGSAHSCQMRDQSRTRDGCGWARKVLGRFSNGREESGTPGDVQSLMGHCSDSGARAVRSVRSAAYSIIPSFSRTFTRPPRYTLFVSALLAQHTWQFSSNLYKNHSPFPMPPSPLSTTFGQPTAVTSWPLS